METFIEIIERVGVPVAMCMAFGYFIWKQNQFIQNELQKECGNRLAGWRVL